jgi:hypothetical protein
MFAGTGKPVAFHASASSAEGGDERDEWRAGKTRISPMLVAWQRQHKGRAYSMKLLLHDSCKQQIIRDWVTEQKARTS